MSEAEPVPDLDARPTTIRLPGAVPTLLERFQGCFFTGRCPRKIGPVCDQTPPAARIGSDSSSHIIYFHIYPIIFITYVFNHTCRHDTVKFFVYISVIL